MTHSYSEYENTVLWEKVNQIIEDLVKNEDIQETTAREYIVGYFCKSLMEERE